MPQPANNKIPLRSHAASGLNGDATVPGDKSLSHRALMLASQRIGATAIEGLLESEDVLHTANALRLLGVPVTRQALNVWQVQGVGVGGLAESNDILDMGNSGTGARLLMGLVAPYPFTTFFTGDESLRRRPMGRVITPLSLMGAAFAARDGNKLPLALSGTADAMPITYRLPVASAQVKSAILLAALNTAGVTTVIEPVATRDHTENMLRHFGFRVESEPCEAGMKIALPGYQTVAPGDRELTVPADPSSAAFLAVAALLCKDSRILLRNVCVNPLRIGLFTTLKEMGAAIAFRNERLVAGEPVADLEVRSSTLKGIVVPAEAAPSMIDEYPVLAVAAACAEGVTVMHGLSELRVKESDRLSAVVAALQACGVQARAEGDSLHVTGCGGAPEGGATVVTHYDHRIAMAFLVLGMVSKQPVTVDDSSAIATSFPGFATLMNGLGAHIAPVDARLAEHGRLPLVIAIDGPAASGKGTLARRLAEHFGLDYLDTGSIYRAVGMKLVYAGKDPHDVQEAVAAAKAVEVEDLSNPRLRQERIGNAASIVSAFPQVREILLDFQRRFAAGGKGAVLDGRDIGTVVCPRADYKFFITATLEARAKRRHRELQGQGIDVVFESVLEDLRARDTRDEKRNVAPLKPADSAIVIDSSALDANHVFEQVRRLIQEKSESKSPVATL